MATIIPAESDLPTDWSVADLQRHLGGVPAERVRLFPPPGTATLQHLVAIAADEDRLYELVDGILVEKTVGWYESLLAGLILTRLNLFLQQHDLGKALGADGALQIMPATVRIPDVSFISRQRFPTGAASREPVPRLVPDLAVEVLSRSNTEAEMQRKLQEYFAAGTRLVWLIDPETRSARAYTSLDEMATVARDGVLSGGEVLPGFHLSLSELFATADR